MKKIILLFFSALCINSAYALDTNSMKCEDGVEFQVAYLNSNPEDYRAILYYKDKLYVLDNVISANGSRYVGEGIQWWTTANEGYLLEFSENENPMDKFGVTCKSISEEIIQNQD